MATPAVRLLTDLGIPFEVHSYDHDPAERSYGLEAARMLHVDPSVVFKTIIFLIEPRHPAAAIVPVTSQVDTKAVARALGVKRVDPCPVAAAERLTGYVVGGISPFGQKTPSRTVLDESADSYDRIFVSAGRRGLEVSLSPADLLEVTNGLLAPIASSTARA